MKKKLFLTLKTIVFLTLFITVERFCHHKTVGFRVHKIESHFPYDERYAVNAPTDEQKEEVQKILSQRFTFLGDGGQGYSFLSEDGEYVLKFFKLHHMRVPTLFTKLPLFGPLKKAQQDFITYREKNHEKIFGSCRIAYEKLKEETGLVYLHLNKTQDEHPTVMVVDPIGIAHPVALDKTAFALQKKAHVAFRHVKQAMLSKDEKAVKTTIDNFVSFVGKRCQKGVEDLDAGFKRNYGMIGDKLIEIDIGSFCQNDALKSAERMKEEILKKTEGLRRSLAARYPEMLPYLDKTLAEVCTKLGLSSERSQKAGE